MRTEARSIRKRLFALASEVFGFSAVNVKPISGHVAAMAVLISLARRGDKIMAISPQLGGYDGYHEDYMAGMLGLHVSHIPMKDMRVPDVDAILSERPNLIIMGASYILFPYPLKEVLDVAEDIGAKVVYDASHVMGLLPAGFQPNIHECAVVYGSTHKSYPGPQGGIVMSNDSELMKKIGENLTWKVQDNYHTNRVAALGASLEEFGPVAGEYGRKVARNSQALGAALHALGLAMLAPPEFSQSHQLLVDVSALNANFGLRPAEFGEVLERNGIIVDRVGRIGTAELTWKGYGVEDMRDIAKLIVRAARGENVKSEVDEMVSRWDGKTLGE